MLTELHIENIAVIERADISFSPGLNVLCGETGSGKSIVIDSLNAVLGSRTSRDLVRHGAEKALVTAVFEPANALPWLEENEIPCDGEVILQRRITAEGKTTSRVCGVPVTAAQLRELASQLVDIHGQNDGLRLLDEKSHLAFLDSFGQTDQALGAFQSEYSRFTGILKEIRDLSMDDEEKLRLSDSLRYRIDELEKASLKEGEYDSLSARRDLLRNSEKLREALDNALTLLSEADESAEPAVQNALYYADRAARLAPELEEAAAALRQASAYLEDASERMRDFRDSLDFSPEEYDGIESRISLLDRLSRKYSRDESGLIELLESSRTKLQDIEYSEDKIVLLKKELQQQQERCAEKGRELTLLRKKAAKALEKRIIQELQELNMPFVRFAVEFAPVDSKTGFRRDGADEVRFLISANAGEELGRISRIASGGELSRIMLALKNVFAEHDSVQTMVFDEIDTGVSGISAQRVAEKLYTVSKNRQVMCVTHLPQIAAMADSQYLVSKTEKDGRTYTQITLLDEEGRKQEIARLYGGDHITETTLAAAAEQLLADNTFKKGVKS